MDEKLNSLDEYIESVQERLFQKNCSKIARVIDKAMHTTYYSNLIVNDKVLYYEDFKKIPILTKEELKKNMFDMISDDIVGFRKEIYQNIPYGEKREYLKNYGLELRVTSGSTGVPIEIIKSKHDLQRDYIHLNMNRKKLSTYDFKGNFLWIWPVNPSTRAFFYPNDEVSNIWRVNEKGVQYMLYSYSDECMLGMYEYIIKNNVEWISTSPNAIIRFIEYLDKNHLSIGSIVYVECHSEFLYSWQRKKIEEKFNCECVSIYSSNEVQFIAGTNSCNNVMSLFDDNCFLEFVSNPYGGYHVCVTSLSYYDVPIIRYCLGDCGNWLQKDAFEDDVYEFQLTKYRENDYLLKSDGTRMESFVLTDSIIWLQGQLGVDINLYKVIQKKYEYFEYYFDYSLNITNRHQDEKILEEYLSSIIGYHVEVRIFQTNINNFTDLGQKLRYIEIDSSFLKQVEEGKNSEN